MLALVLVILALICFALAALGATVSRVNLVGAGLFFWALSSLV